VFRVFRGLLLSLIIVLAAFSAMAQGTAVVPPLPIESAAEQKRQEAFELVWQTINERFYDPTFGGVDWKKQHDRYAPLVAAASSDQEVHLILQRMVNELHRSHLVIIPPNSIPKFIPPRRTKPSGVNESDDDSEDAEQAGDDENDLDMLLDKGNPKLTERLSTGIGIDLRIVNRSVLITHVDNASSAARAGLRPGFVIKGVDRRPLNQAVAEIENNPIWSSILRSDIPLVLLARYLNGPPGSMVNLLVLDGKNRRRNVNVRREKLNGEMSPAVGNLPPMYTEFESKLLPGGIGYIRFNAFVPPLMKKVCAAIRSFRDAPGIVIDLRGNQGGLLGMVNGVSGLLNTVPVSLGTMKTRSGETPLYAFPQRSPYKAAVAIIIDGSTQSAAEMFASAMMETGRAIVVGERSAGNTLPSSILKLPTGARFQYAWASFQTVSGKLLEGSGLTPDVSVALNRRDLLLGRDPQLDIAILNVRQQAELDRTLREMDSARASEKPEGAAENNKSISLSVADADDSPPPPVPVPAVEVAKKTPSSTPPGVPSVEEIVEKYLRAAGSLEAMEHFTSRISTGSVEVPSTGLKGTVELYEAVPERSSLIINFPGYGVTQRTFDGANGWVQDPLQGFVKFTGIGLDRLKGETEFRRELRLRDSVAKLTFDSKAKVGNREAFVVRTTVDGLLAHHWYFDTETGLLLRRDNVYYEDYRDVDGVKLPFKVRDETFYGFPVVMSFSEIKHNAPVDESKFKEYVNCFTNP